MCRFAPKSIFPIFFEPLKVFQKLIHPDGKMTSCVVVRGSQRRNLLIDLIQTHEIMPLCAGANENENIEDEDEDEDTQDEEHEHEMQPPRKIESRLESVERKLLAINEEEKVLETLRTDCQL